ncbi:MAG TPA: hypothetical protein VNA25_14720 [Phycisphaerae bacterium]|nr:hypothetical protein [Phycisphaerae bacterium]
MTDPTTPDPNVQDWKTALPEDIRENESLASLKDVGELAKGYLDVQQKFAAIVPAPESADKYTVELPPLPEGVTDDATKKTVLAEMDKDIATLRAMAFENKLSQAQFQGLVALYGKQLAETHKEQISEYKAEMGKLETEWGKDYAAKSDLATKTAEKLAAPKWMLAHPEGIKWFASIGPKFAEDGTVDGKPPGVRSPNDAGNELASRLYPAQQ